MRKKHAVARAQQYTSTLLVSLVLIGSVFQGSLVFPAQAAEYPPEDRDISRTIENTFLLNESVPMSRIDVRTNTGIVTLTGSVHTLFAKHRAAELAQAVKGVRAVVNRIQVKPIARTDAQIQNDVVTALARDPATDSYELMVEVEDGVVALAGTVQSWQEQQLAARVARDVKGVKAVKNNTTFTYTPDRTDDEIKADITRRLEWDAWISDELIAVEVDNGQVTLQGAVGSAAEKHRVYSNAWVSGVQRVDDSKLEVQWWARDTMRKKTPCTAKSDEAIKAAVTAAFRYDPRVYTLNPEVDVQDGVVTLSGGVDNLKAKNAAEQDARNTACVWRVKNYLKVRPTNPPSDAVLSQHIQDVLTWDPYINQQRVTTVVSQGRVSLIGTVDSLFDKARVEDAVSRVSGVVAVSNNLTVHSSRGQKEDWEIKQDIRDALFWSPLVDSTEVSVAVEDGIATLTGTVDTWLERSMARENALAGGAERVRNKLQVRDRPNFVP